MKVFRWKKSPALLAKKKSNRPRVEFLEDRLTPSVTVGVSVAGMNTTDNFCNCQPPDPMGAAGPSHIVHMVNTAIEIFNKNGTVAVAPVSTMSFFGNHLGNHSDPWVFYDNIAGKFVAGILDFGSTNAANLIDWATGVDSASGITWTIQSPISSGDGSNFFDYPRTGFNADGWFFDGNMFAANSFVHVQIITVSKTTDNVLSRHFDSSLFTATPAQEPDSVSGGPEYIVESANGGASTLQVVAETNVLSSSPTFTTTAVTVPSYRSGGSAPQGVPGFDDRIIDAADRTIGGVNHLVAAHQVASSRHNSAPVARWYDINTATMSLIQSGNAPAGVNGAATFTPSVSINTAGSIGMTFSESAKSEFWSMYVTERKASDASGTMEAAVKVASGVARTPDSRIGDFSATTVDPADGLTFWSINQYQGSDFWDTHIASFSIAGAVHGPHIVATLPNAGALRGASITVTNSSESAAVNNRAVPSTVIGSQTNRGLENLTRVQAARAVDAFWSSAASKDFLGSAF
jgi:hypothetical protein